MNSGSKLGCSLFSIPLSARLAVCHDMSPLLFNKPRKISPPPGYLLFYLYFRIFKDYLFPSTGKIPMMIRRNKKYSCLKNYQNSTMKPIIKFFVKIFKDDEMFVFIN